MAEHAIIDLHFTKHGCRKTVTKYIGNQGYDPVYGARPLKRAIQHHLLDPLSLEILDGKFKEGDVITADVDHGAVIFKVD